MGFKGESAAKRRDKNAPRRANGLQMILIFIILGVSVFAGWWVPLNIPLRAYVPIRDDWYTPLIPHTQVMLIQLVVGLAVFILLQFVLVLLSGFLFPLPPVEQYDKDGLYIGKTKND
jgi:hypothetical protein